MSSNFRAVIAICSYDLKRELKNPLSSGAVLVFGISALVVLRLALAGDSRPTDPVLAGTLWVLLLFSTILGASRVWSSEQEEGAFDAFLCSPLARWALYLGKTLSLFITTILIHLLLLLLYFAAFTGPKTHSGQLLLLISLLLVDIGFAAIGTLVSGFGIRARSRDLLGPVLFLPLSIPLVIVATTLTIAAYAADFSNLINLLSFLIAYALVFTTAGLAAFPEVAVE